MKPKIKAQNKEHLKQLIQQEIAQYSNECDLSHIDISEVIDVTALFVGSDISSWNTSNIKDMNAVFRLSSFRSDISKWGTSKVIDMSHMFSYSKFNQDISDWDVSEVFYINEIFRDSQFSFDLSN